MARDCLCHDPRDAPTPRIRYHCNYSTFRLDHFHLPQFAVQIVERTSEGL
jgi:hypothetical protein